MMLRKKIHMAAWLAAVLALAACGGTPATEEELMTTDEARKARVGDLFGEDAFVFGPGARKNAEAETGGRGMAVNGYLWRASLDTMSFMPLTSADPFGGVIVTDWYVPPESPNERFKVQVYILDRQLRADGLRVTLFRQVRGAYGDWIDAEVMQQTKAELENAILTRARQLRVDAGGEI